MKIDVGRFYRSRDGAKIRIYALDGCGEWSIHGAIFSESVMFGNEWKQLAWRLNGTSGHDGFDIVSEWEEPATYNTFLRGRVDLQAAQKTAEEHHSLMEKCLREWTDNEKPKEKKPRMLAYLRLRDDAETMELFFRPIHRDQVTQEVLDAFTNRAPWLDSPEEE